MSKAVSDKPDGTSSIENEAVNNCTENIENSDVETYVNSETFEATNLNEKPEEKAEEHIEDNKEEDIIVPEIIEKVTEAVKKEEKAEESIGLVPISPESDIAHKKKSTLSKVKKGLSTVAGIIASI